MIPLLAAAVPEAVLTILKFTFLALIYLFLWQVVRAVLLELKPVTVGGRAPKASPAEPRSKNRSARIRILEPVAHRGETYTIDSEITIGRGQGCGIVLSGDEFASIIHARVFANNDEVFVEDLKSRNGTLVNGQTANGIIALNHGDRVQLGETILEIIR